ncbi:unnamed protein product [Brachionus calyciflorus]|uniref:type I protein arginine methyltransferase n=1 Tax=Brachionus calyciflorus TaxID=104777 RepID=A0A813TLU3_9BILA|nr:unnamed protein product [Brachionus calyciflorus]
MSRLLTSERVYADSESDEDIHNEEDYDEEEDDFENIPVKGLFSDKTYANVREMFKSEFEENKFNLVHLVNKLNMNQIDYIKMINYIRTQRPSPSELEGLVKNESELPWVNDSFMKTILEDDPALQFDVEEDLDLLDFGTEINNNETKQVSELQNIKKMYQNTIKEKDSKIEELMELVNKLRNVATNLLNHKETRRNSESGSETESDNDDSVYVNSYSNYSIHLEMLQDQVRTEGYMKAILDNKDLFRDKVVLDVGCGSGILSLFAAKAGAKKVIAVDMSEILNKAVLISKENEYEDKIVFLKGKMEEVKLPVDQVDIIISEWMGYFLLFESMLDSVLFARDKYLNKETGVVLPNFFDMHLFAVSDMETYDRTVNFWSNVYGFKMNVMRKVVCKDAQIQVIDKDKVVSDLFKFKDIDCMNVKVKDISKFSVDFSLKIIQDAILTGLGSSFDTYFNHSSLQNKSSFSTSPFHKETHWQQTLFQFEEPINAKKDDVITGKITCYKNPNYLRSYCVELNVLDRLYTYKVE